ncbi:MFS transporter [Peribacillus simplex]|uniref:MFS transporter n=1 Tax=Peribacillus simplex TaxID=1478 RepID=A0A8B5XTW4_9BACI|nr:MFS transporter [Peribacillus simplex]MED3909660.1 MFS transporter [Peribacillus simplex]MED3986253.1 MFS transporter [Peribacillus simplex]MED4097437.1 MFS transporter [Peribacillus simplex]TVX77725.1 MFS transporter [Peribacillus simplex]CAH0240165.1 Purine efflux pump PbuE [Peribacillus simplex]
MDKRVYLLAIVSFVVGMVELIIGGLLDIVANDLDVSLGQAGFLMTVFSLAFALAAPILLSVTQRVERKRLTLITLFIFLLGNVIAILSPYYSILLVGRIIAASSGSLLIALCLTMVPNIVTEQYRARAIGIVFMGVSASLVLGVPIGLMLGNAFGWRAPFIMISILTLVSMAGVFFFLERMAPKPSIPIRRQLRTLKNRKILFAQATSFVMLTGHLTLYGYLTPFLKMKLGLDGTWVSIVYLIFGIAAVVGGGIGGFLADRFGSKRTIISVIIFFAVSMLSIPYTTFSLPLFLILMVIWSMLSWAITPAMQSYLIELSPETSDIQQTLNNSAVHVGIAFGSFIGGIVIEQTSVEFNPTVGGVLVLISLGTAALSVMSYGHQEFKKS